MGLLRAQTTIHMESTRDRRDVNVTCNVVRHTLCWTSIIIPRPVYVVCNRSSTEVLSRLYVCHI